MKAMTSPLSLTFPRRGDNPVPSDHSGQHADGAVHEGHGHTLRPPRPQRYNPQDHGEQAVLRGKHTLSIYAERLFILRGSLVFV